MTKTEALQCLMILKASYPRAEVNEETLLAYATMLDDVDREQAQSAIKRIICKSKWFPAIAEIRAEIAEASIASLTPVDLAWGEVWKAISKYGMNRTPIFSSPEISAAVDAIGWRQICLDENVTATRANFREAYRAIRDGRKQAEQLGPHAPQLPRQAGGYSIVAGLLSGGDS